MKLAQKLQNIKESRVLPLIRLGHPKFNDLAIPSFKITDINPKLQADIQSLRMTASKGGFVSLSSIQVGIKYAFFVIKCDLTHNQWFYKRSEPSDYDVVLNPVINDSSQLQQVEWEECPSFGFQMYKIKRPSQVQVLFQNELMNIKTEVLSGFRARVFQHEFDHLCGTTFSTGNKYFKISPRLQQLSKESRLEDVEEELQFMDQYEEQTEMAQQYYEKLNKIHGKN